MNQDLESHRHKPSDDKRVSESNFGEGSESTRFPLEQRY